MKKNLKYKSELIRSMSFLAKNKKTIFIGQSVSYSGNAIYNTLSHIPSNRKIELPVFEEVQLGISTGLALSGFIPITCFPRFDFLILAMNQLVNHLDKYNVMTGEKNIKAIIRTGIGSQRPLHPQHQHIGDFTDSIKNMCTTIDVIKLNEPEDIFPAYEKAFNRKDGRNTIIVEYGDYYNEK